jgi:hypothetical protein
MTSYTVGIAVMPCLLASICSTSGRYVRLSIQAGGSRQAVSQPFAGQIPYKYRTWYGRAVVVVWCTVLYYTGTTIVLLSLDEAALRSLQPSQQWYSTSRAYRYIHSSLLACV